MAKLILRELDEQTFDTFAKNEPTATFLQSVELYKRYKLEHREAYLLGGFKNDKLVAAALCVQKYARLGQKIFNLPRGPILDYSDSILLTDFLEQVEQFLQKKGAMVLQISPNIFRKVQINEKPDTPDAQTSKSRETSDNLLRGPWPTDLAPSLSKHGYKNLGEFEQIKWAYFLDLEGKTEEDLLMSFRYDARRSIKQNASRYHLSLRELKKPEDLAPFRELIERTGARRGFQNPNPNYFINMQKTFDGRAHFILAECDESKLADIDKPKTGPSSNETPIATPNISKPSSALTPVSTGLFIQYGPEVVYLYSGSDPAYNKMNAPVLIIWEMIKLAREKGCKYFNFYGTHPFPTSVDASVFRFKQNFHGDIVEYVGTFAKPLNLAGKLYLSRLNYAEVRAVA